MAIVGSWPCDEGSGTTLADDSGNGLDLTPGDAPTWISSEQGLVPSFNGTSDNLQNSSWPSFNPTSAITVAMLVKGPAQDNQIVLSHYDTGSNQRAWTIGTANSSWTVGDTSHLGVIITQNGTTSSSWRAYEATDDAAFDDAWHHIAFTFGSDTLALYVDGVAQAVSQQVENSMTGIFDSSANLMLGALFVAGSPSNFFEGEVSDIVIHDAVLSAGDIATLASGLLAVSSSSSSQSPVSSQSSSSSSQSGAGTLLLVQNYRRMTGAI